MIDRDQLFAEKLKLGIETYVDTTELESIFFNDTEKDGSFHFIIAINH